MNKIKALIGVGLVWAGYWLLVAVGVVFGAVVLVSVLMMFVTTFNEIAALEVPAQVYQIMTVITFIAALAALSVVTAISLYRQGRVRESLRNGPQTGPSGQQPPERQPAEPRSPDR